MNNQDYLSHHGILGMKWGRRNGPPYPLSPGDHSSSEKKAGWEDSLSPKARKKMAKEYQKKLNNLDKQAVKEIDKQNITANQLEKQRAKYQKNVEYQRLANSMGEDFYVRLSNKHAGKALNKLQKAADENIQAKIRYKLIEEETWKVIGDAVKNGYDIESEKVYRDARKGKRALGQLLLGPVGQLAFAGSSAGNYGIVEGNRYKVGSGSSDRMGSYTTRVRVRGS